MSIHVIGIDCATVGKKTGLARGEFTEEKATVSEVRVCTDKEKPAEIVVRWLRGLRHSRTLLAIDAPLGWPQTLSRALINHQAGRGISSDPCMMFQRETDRFVHRVLGKAPLEVGADRIARTALFALQFLAGLRTKIHADIPLVWSEVWTGIAAIEVYPAATLRARRLTAVGYKKPRQTGERESLIQNLRTHLILPLSPQPMIDSADALDAAVCVLAGWDFLRGQVHAPTDHALAQQEGWIWFLADVQ